MLAEPLAVTRLVTDALNELGVPYAIGGSLASAVHGVMRATMDADLVALLIPQHADPLVVQLEGAFYVDAHAVRNAIRRNGSFNLIHLDTMFKVDVFAARERAFDRAQLERRELQVLSESPEYAAYVISAEDIVLAKLEWYQAGGGVSDRQWRDVLGVIQVQGDQLDSDYLRRMASTLDVQDLLAKALAEAR